ncbi:MAG: Fe-S cluster assembly protein SufB [bacterium]
MKSKETDTLDNYKYGFSYPEKYVFKSEKGLSERVVKNISEIKKEPLWMREYRLKAYASFVSQKMPSFGPNLTSLNFNDIFYYLKPLKKQADNWKSLPKEIKETYERLGIPKAEQEYLSGVKAQYESEMIYGSLIADLKDKGVLFLGMDEGLEKYPDLVKEYFGKAVSFNDNKFSALNSAVWSGGSFIYIPKNVKVKLPLQAYFRINAKRMGQFERTLIIADEGSFVSYLEGCTAPLYSEDSLHCAVVEIFVKKNARVRYTTVQNWSKNVYNLVTKRALVYENGVMEWVDGNIGSKVTMKYPSVFLMEKRAKGTILSIGVANKGQEQDIGGKVLHLAENTSSQIVSKSISKNGGKASYRGLVKIAKNAHDCKSNVVCDGLILDEFSVSNTYPFMDIKGENPQISHEAFVGRINEEQLFYLTSRGIPEKEAISMLVNGFIEPIAKEFPMEYSMELNKLVSLEIENDKL